MNEIDEKTGDIRINRFYKINVEINSVIKTKNVLKKEIKALEETLNLWRKSVEPESANVKELLEMKRKDLATLEKYETRLKNKLNDKKFDRPNKKTSSLY